MSVLKPSTIILNSGTANKEPEMYAFKCRVFEVVLLAVFLAILTGCAAPQKRDDKPQNGVKTCVIMPLGSQDHLLLVRMRCEEE